MPSFSFDSSVEDIFTTLVSGAQLVLMKDLRLNLNKLITILGDYKVTNLLAVPSYYNNLLDMISERLNHMRFVAIAGEGFSDALIKKHFRKLQDVQLFNEYGPTENSVCSTVCELNPE
ncbi:AMP-binding protein, partial [Burkholderia sp. SIMBA_019]